MSNQDDLLKNVCGSCDRNYECGVLSSALAILEEHEMPRIDQKCARAYREFREKLKRLGYGYPVSQVSCQLQKDKELVRMLVEEAKNLVASFTRELFQRQKDPEKAAS